MKFTSTRNILLAVLLGVIHLPMPVSGGITAPFKNTPKPSKRMVLDVSGKVTDKVNGQSLPGVSILIKGTNSGTITNVDGGYKLSLPDNSDATLVFSFIGYVSQEVKVGSQQVIDIKLDADVSSLNEIVVVGAEFTQTLPILLSAYIPNKVLQSSITQNGKFPLLVGKSPLEGICYYHCRDYVCKEVEMDLGKFLANL